MVKAIKWELGYRVYCLRVWWNVLPNRLLQSLAHLLPRKLVYFCAIRVWANASFEHTNQHVGSLTAEQMLDAWSKAKHV